MSTNLHAGAVQRENLRGCHHQIVGWLDLHGLRNLFRQLSPLGHRKVLDLSNDSVDGRAFLRNVSRWMPTQPEIAQVQCGQWARPHRFNHRVVPHSPAIKIAGGNEEGGGQAVTLQYGQGNRVIVQIPVAELYVPLFTPVAIVHVDGIPDTSVNDLLNSSVPEPELSLEIDKVLTNDTCTITWTGQYVSQCYLVNSTGGSASVTTSGTGDVEPGTYWLRCLAQRDGSVVESESVTCRLNPGIREI